MSILYASLLNNNILLINLVITSSCLIIVLLIQYLTKKARMYSTLPIKESLESKATTEKELPSVGMQTIIQQIPFDLEVYGLIYNMKYDFFTNTNSCKKRIFGACRLYDESAAPLGVIIDIENIYFDYNNKHWLIQLQKGQYGLASGGEISVYQTTLDSIFISGYFHGSFYECNTDEDPLLVSYSIMNRNDVFLTRKSSSWCVNSYRLGSFSEPEDLTMHIRITFPTLGMCQAFYDALIELGYEAEAITTRHNTIYFIFDEPKSPQPLTRNILTTYIMQKNNFSYITAYDYITQDYSETFSKLAYLKNYFPEMYQEIIKIGQPAEMYDDYTQIANYLSHTKEGNS
ncbi:protein of unknown function [Anaerosporobacter mobilis DSM 15930]|uniref:DUF4474 domain-containing protein n=1 Tax=Anaerosporobacter mobilis DSM 15930 TaxID=1120996 RepID=A0A1M7M491_9FIRM|nr:DUF4474 domain-containing protein [Anaerosporobacter mobilis]SHM85446.1 protein of unknown function [Anaerosporobacter mobilis DSM 15930]